MSRNKKLTSNSMSIADIKSGMKFGMLTTMNEKSTYNKRKQKVRYWEVICDCGTYKTVKASHLRDGSIVSCGCLIGLLNSLRVPVNRYELVDGTYYIGYDCKSRTFKFDAEDYEKVSAYHWVVRTLHGETRYVTANVRENGKRKTLQMHNYLTGYKSCDHINRDKTDNRKDNLRFATQADNVKNISKPVSNTSGVMGVGFCKHISRWRAFISINGEYRHIGTFINKNDAIRARLNAELEYYGEFAPQKHLHEEYGVCENGV